MGLLLVCALGLFGWTPVASALRAKATSRSLPGSPSNFDGSNGNVVTAETGKTDWDDLNLNQIGHTADVVNGTGANPDDHFTSGSKDFHPNGWVLTNSGALGEPEGDFGNIWWADERNHVTGDAFLYVALSRFASSGSIFLSFELNQDPVPWKNGAGSTIPCRTNGDLLLSLEVHGTDKTIHAYKWTTTNLDPSGRCAADGSLSPVQDENLNLWLEGAFNAQAISHHALPGQPATMGVGLFGEVAVNLTKLDSMGADEPCADSKFKSIWAHSESSPTASDLDSELKDYVAPSELNIQGCQAHPTLATQVHPSGRVPVGTQIQDTATLNGTSASPTGTVKFELFRVRRNGDCAATPVDTQSEVTAGASGDFTSLPYTPTRAGTYSWVVTYSGDNNNAAVGPTPCGDSSETVRLTKARPTIETLPAPQTGLTGARFRDTGKLSGGFRPTGRVTFRLFPPDNQACTGQPFRTQRVRLNAQLTATSRAVTITQAGIWHWVATYSGDRNNRPFTSPCDAEPITVIEPPPIPPEVPGFDTTASPGGPLGTTITDTAHLGSTSTPTGSITFELFGPDDPNCTKLVAADTVPVMGAGDYTSEPVTPPEAGTYRWVATYSGDPAHTPAATGCGDIGEGADLSKASPAVTTSASDATVDSGHAVGDTAVLTGAVRPSGTITFRLYGPDDATCSRAPVFVAHQHVVIGSDTTQSPMPTPELPGIYRWVVTYSGDANNAGAATSCGDPAEMFVVNAPVVHPPEHIAPRLALTKEMPAHAHVGSVVPVTITVRNTGSVAALHVRVTDNPPSGGRLQVTASNATGKPNGTVVWVIGTLAPGAARTLHATMRITAAAPRGMRNRATADASNAPTATAAATVRVPRPGPGPPGGPPPFTG